MTKEKKEIIKKLREEIKEIKTSPVSNQIVNQNPYFFAPRYLDNDGQNIPPGFEDPAFL